MRFHARRALASVALALMMFISAPAAAGQQIDHQILSPDPPSIQRRIPEAARAGPLAFARTELYFGTARPDGVVTHKQFQKFVDEKITPRFPDGLTLVKGHGQFRGEDDVVIREQSFVLILLYPLEGFGRSSQKIERIRTLYKEQFDQQSVLRVDDPYVVWVSF
jgi:Protein of unknown function (DUF3574)